MPTTITFLIWATAFLFIGLIILIGRRFIIKSATNHQAVSGIARLLLILGFLVMAIGAFLMIAMLFVN